MAMTFADTVHTYAKLLLAGRSDDDLTRRQQNLTGVVLNIAMGEAILFTYDYPPSDATRTAALRRINEINWEFGAIPQQLGKRADEDFQIAIRRAHEILRNI